MVCHIAHVHTYAYRYVCICIYIEIELTHVYVSFVYIYIYTTSRTVFLESKQGPRVESAGVHRLWWSSRVATQAVQLCRIGLPKTALEP